MNMNEIEKRMQSQLIVIETVYDIKIQNRDEVISIAAKYINDPRQVLWVCTSINTWIANNKMKGTVVVPEAVVLSLMKRQ